MVFFNVVFPVFLIIGIGYLLVKVTDIKTKSISKTALYVFIPCLYFNSMVTAKIDNNELLKILCFSILLFIIFVTVIFILSSVLGYSRQLRSALILSTSFANSGNYGLPIILFAFSQAGFERAVIYSVCQSLLINTAGVYFAASSSNNFITSFKKALKMPAFIAITAALVLRYFNIIVPDPILKPIAMLGQAGIPVFIIILGMQLGQLKAFPDWKFTGIASVLRLTVYPLIGFLLTLVFFDAGSLTSQVLIVITAVPTSTSIVVIAAQYDSKPELVSAVAFATTLFSVVTVSLLLTLVT